MIDWGLATRIFIVGVFTVMFVMFLLQVSVNLCSKVVRMIERKRIGTKQEL